MPARKIGQRDAALYAWGSSALIAAAFVMLYAVPLEAGVRARTAPLLFVLPVVLALASTGLAARRSEGRERLFWLALAGAIGAFLVAMVGRTYDVWFGRDVRVSRVEDVAFLVGFALLAPIVMLLADSSRLTSFRRLGDLMDFAAVLVAAGAAAVYLIWRPNAGGAGGEPQGLTFAAMAVAAIAPVAYAVIFRHGAWTAWYASLVAALGTGGLGVATAVIEEAFALYNPGTRAAGVADGLMFVSFLLLAVSGVLRIGAHPRESRVPSPVLSQPGWRVVWGSVLALMGVPAFAQVSATVSGALGHGVITALASVFAAFVVGRGCLHAVENIALASQAMSDPLTGLRSAVNFDEALARETKTALDGAYPLSLCVLDVTGLASFNRARGYAAGDAALKRIAVLLMKHRGERGIAARIGGDDFALLLPKADGETARATCLEIVRELASSGIGGPDELRLAVGVAELPASETHHDELLRLAQGAAYWSREMGGEDVVLYDPLLIDVLDSREHIARLERETHTATVETLAAAVDARDHYTRNHSQNVAELAGVLAREIGLPESRVEMVHAAGLLHDVGKIGVSDQVLLKAGPLTPDERLQVQEHPCLAERILRSAVRPEMLAWIRAHHERWDGTGYPDGLKGAEIPTEARILAICDAFDAITSDRPYRAGKALAETLGEIRACAGSQFDPGLVEVLLELAGGRAAQLIQSVKSRTDLAGLLHPSLPSVIAELLEDSSYSTLLAVNDEFCEVFGYTREEAIAITPIQLEAQRRIGDSQSGPAPTTLEAMARGAIPRMERELRRKDGTIVPVELTFGSVERDSHRLLILTGRPLYVDAATRRAVERRARKLEALVASTRRLSERLATEEILTEGVRCAIELAEARQGAVGLCREDGTMAFRLLTRGSPEPSAEWISRGDRIAGAVIATREAYTEIGPHEGAEDTPGDVGHENRAGVLGLLAVPIIGSDGRVSGVIEVHNAERAFFEDDAALLQGLAAALAIALDNASVLTRLEERGQTLTEQQSAMRALASELVLTEERERRAIAADLHDGIGQALQICKMMVARASVSDDPAEIGETLHGAESLLAQAIHDTRTLMFEISPPVLYDIGLEAALEWLVDNQKTTTSARCTVVDDGSRKPLSATMGALVYRMARELLMNAIKHSGASDIELSARSIDGRLVVEVTDDGVGFDPKGASGGFGLRRMREQIAGLGGLLELDSRPGSGTKARLLVPLGTPADD